jgi:hypothetical protein
MYTHTKKRLYIPHIYYIIFNAFFLYYTRTHTHISLSIYTKQITIYILNYLSFYSVTCVCVPMFNFAYYDEHSVYTVDYHAILYYNCMHQHGAQLFEKTQSNM